MSWCSWPLSLDSDSSEDSQGTPFECSRREAVAGLTVLVSGCGGNQSSSSPTQTPTKTATPTDTPTDSPTDSPTDTPTETETETETPEPVPERMQPVLNPVEDPDVDHDPADEAYFNARLTQEQFRSAVENNTVRENQDVITDRELGYKDWLSGEVRPVRSSTERDITDVFYEEVLTEEEINNINSSRGLIQTVWNGAHRVTNLLESRRNDFRTSLMREFIEQSGRYIDRDLMPRNLGALNDPERDNEEAQGITMTSSPNVPTAEMPGNVGYQTVFFDLGEDGEIYLGDHLVTERVGQEGLGSYDPHLRVYNGDHINGDRLSKDFSNRSTGLDLGYTLAVAGGDISEEGAESAQSAAASGLLYGGNKGRHQTSNTLALAGEESNENFLLQPDDPRSRLIFDTYLDGHTGDKMLDSEEYQEGLDLDGNRARRAFTVLAALNTKVYEDRKNNNLTQDGKYDSNCYKFTVNENGVTEVWQVPGLSSKDYENSYQGSSDSILP